MPSARLLGGHHLSNYLAHRCLLISRPDDRLAEHDVTGGATYDALVGYGESRRRKAADRDLRAVETYERLRVELGSDLRNRCRWVCLRLLLTDTDGAPVSWGDRGRNTCRVPAGQLARVTPVPQLL